MMVGSHTSEMLETTLQEQERFTELFKVQPYRIPGFIRKTDGVAESFLLASKHMRSTPKRKNGAAYITHPVMVAYLASVLIDNREEREALMHQGLFHDHVEEPPIGYNVNRWNAFVQSMPPALHFALDSAVMVTPPPPSELSRTIARVASVRQVQLYGIPPEQKLKVLDRLSNMIDTTYLDDNPHAQSIIARKHIAPAQYTLDALHVEKVFARKAQSFIDMFRESQRVHRSTVRAYVRNLERVYDEHTQEMDEASTAYMRRFGVDRTPKQYSPPRTWRAPFDSTLDYIRNRLHA